MSSLINHLHIKNFKSVRDLALDCERINLFIGKPNAGKSNILEAISLLGAGYCLPEEKFMQRFIRYGNVTQLFSDFNFREAIEVRANEFLAKLSSSKMGNRFEFSIPWKSGSTDLIAPIELQILLDGSFTKNDPNEMHKEFFQRLGTSAPQESDKEHSIKKYTFQSIADYQEKGLFLYPPYGENLFLIVNTHPQLREEIAKFLKPNGLEFLLDVETRQMAIVQKERDSLVRIPMNLVPDTFQRYIFHLAAILSNRDSVLLFEEPEAHSYGPYIYQLAQQMLDDEGGNQYFITTHNPYFLLPLIQEGKDVAVFTTWFEDFQTHARRLSEDEIREMLDYGVDVFLNLDQFIPA